MTNKDKDEDKATEEVVDTQEIEEKEVDLDDTSPEAELDNLKEKCDKLGIEYSDKIGLPTLKKRYSDFIKGTDKPKKEDIDKEIVINPATGEEEIRQPTVEDEIAEPTYEDGREHEQDERVTHYEERKRKERKVQMTPNQIKAARRVKMNKEEMKLIRLRIANLNPTKRELRGEIFTVTNPILGTVRKFVPYGEDSDAGYHVPHIIYKQLKARKFLQIASRRSRETGQTEISQRWVPEFSLEVMEPLTAAEISKIAANQAATMGSEA